MVKTVEEIYQEMLSAYGEKTGVAPAEGCDLSARLYACAAQVFSLYVQAGWVARQAFPQTAEREYLDRHAQLRGLERKEPVAARGVVRFAGEISENTDRPIPAGTVCMTAGLIRFETIEDGLLAAGQAHVDVPVQALVPGISGNVAAGTILSMAVAPAGISACSNPSPCQGGVDREGDEQLRQRVLDTFQRLPNGANAAFYQQGALSFDPVAAAVVVPKPRGTGTLDVVVATHQGLPDRDLLDELAKYFQRRREIAVEVQVRAPQTQAVQVAVQVAPHSEYRAEQVLEEVEDAVRGWFTGQRLGHDVLLAQLGSLIYGCDGVANYAILSPTADVEVEQDVLPVLDTLTVEEMP